MFVLHAIFCSYVHVLHSIRKMHIRAYSFCRSRPFILSRIPNSLCFKPTWIIYIANYTALLPPSSMLPCACYSFLLFLHESFPKLFSKTCSSIFCVNCIFSLYRMYMYDVLFIMICSIMAKGEQKEEIYKFVYLFLDEIKKFLLFRYLVMHTTGIYLLHVMICKEQFICKNLRQTVYGLLLFGKYFGFACCLAGV